MRFVQYDNDQPPMLAGETTGEVAGVILPSVSTILRMSDQQRIAKAEEIISAAKALGEDEGKEFSQLVSGALRLSPLPERLIDKVSAVVKARQRGRQDTGTKVSKKRS